MPSLVLLSHIYKLQWNTKVSFFAEANTAL